MTKRKVQAHNPDCFGCEVCLKETVVLDQSKKITALEVENRQLKQAVLLLKAKAARAITPPRDLKEKRECIACGGVGELVVENDLGIPSTVDCGYCDGKGR